MARWRRHRGQGTVAPAVPVRPPVEVVVMSGGGSLGAAQVGAMQALLEAGIVPDAMVGCSVGAINAAYVASNPTSDQLVALERVWRSMSRRSVFPGGRFSVARRLAARADHLYSAEGMRSLMRHALPITDLAETAIPCHIVSTDLVAGEPAWWTSGDAVEILSASAALPGLFPPVRLEGRWHVDGGVSCPVPTQRALDLGAARVWVLDVGRIFHGWPNERISAVDVLLESFAISRAQLGRRVSPGAPGQRVVALPDLPLGRHDMRDFSRTSRLIALGREAGRAMVSQQRRLRPTRTPATV